MGTRSTVQFFSEYDPKKPILCVYQQYDGYIQGVGHDLAAWLLNKKMLNGFSNEKMEDGFANGMGCLVAQYVTTMKTQIGKFYLTTRDDKQEFNYKVRFIDGKFQIHVGRFKGSPEELLQIK